MRLESALELAPGTLVLAGGWKATPSSVREHVRSLEEQSRLARRLADLLQRDGVDQVFRSGELHKMIGAMAPGRAVATGDSVGKGDPDEGGVAVAERPGRAGCMSMLGVLPLQVPVINRVAAGYPTEFTDLGYPARVADEHVSVPDVFDADAFAARVVGDSMEPVYRQGDIVVFSPAAPTVEGSDCFVRFERNAEATFKRVYFEKRAADEMEMIRLQPLNSAYPPRTVEREEVAGLYAAVYVVRPVKAAG